MKLLTHDRPALTPVLLFFFASSIAASNHTSIPDWSDVELDGRTRYLNVLVIYDVTSYNLKPRLLKTEVLELFSIVNEYLYQVDIRISIADFVPYRRKNAPPLDMESFRNHYLSMKPSYRVHDVAVLLQSAFPTITFAQQICSNDSSLILAHFSVDTDVYSLHAARIVQSVFSLIGIDGYAPCKCSARALAANSNRCLTILDMNDCTVQRVADRLQQRPCLLERSYRNHGSIGLCGNGLLEDGEICDAGVGITPLHLVCTKKCGVRPVSIALIAALGSAIIAVGTYFVATRIYARRRNPKLGNTTFVTYLAPEYDHEFCTDPKCTRPTCAQSFSSGRTALEAATRLSTAPGQVYMPSGRKSSGKGSEKFVKRKRRVEERLSRDDSIMSFPHSSLGSITSVHRTLE